ncbi:MAG: DUF4328 domain-containing protein [Fibrobacterales bacterium]
MNTLQDNSQRGSLLLIFVYLVLGLEIGCLFVNYLQYDLLLGAKKGVAISIEVAEANDFRITGFSISYLVVYLLFIVVFIRWFKRAYRNAKLKGALMTYSEKWAIWSWVTPFANLYIPVKMMGELFKETKRLLSGEEFQERVFLSSTIVGVWWTFFIINGIVGQFSSRMDTDTIDQLISSTQVDMLSFALGVPLSIVTILMLKNYMAAEPYVLQLAISDENDQVESLLIDD